MEAEVSAQRVLFVTVGTTAIRPELGETGTDHRRLQATLATFKKRADGRSAAELDALGGNAIFADVVRAHAEVLELGIGDWPDYLGNLSAEMTSTHFLAAHPESRFGGVLDGNRVRIVLLASDTAAGLFCAHVNASLLHRFLVWPGCTCGTRFEDFTGNWGCPAVRVRVVPGMEARRLRKVHESLRGVCLSEAGDRAQIVFNITGGYKGAVPAITWLAFHDFGGRAELFYQHESALAATRFAFLPSTDDGSRADRTPLSGLRLEETVWINHP